MSKRWIVVTDLGERQDVGAFGSKIGSSGVLAFMDEEGEVLMAYAPGSWRTVEVNGAE